MLMKVTDANSVLVFDPRGRVEASDTPIAVRPTSLDGLRLAILDNSKWNANKILRGSAAALQKAVTFRAVNYYVKESFSKDAAPELIEEIAANNDIVLTAIGDCGSCCSCCIRDAIALEKKAFHRSRSLQPNSSARPNSPAARSACRAYVQW